jgi:CheY-like chemotaxis protein
LVILHRRLTERGDGWAFLRRLRADLDTTHLPAIVVAGEAGALPVAAELLRTMRCRVLREPIDAAAVRRAIAAALGRATTPRR